MAWVFFCITAYLTAFVLVPLKEWKRLWPAGIMGLIVLYLIDGTFIRLGAFSYSPGYAAVCGIPVFYMLSGFAGGIVLAYHYPDRKRPRLFYVFIAAAVFLFMELVMHWLGYFHYIEWEPLDSYLLDVMGFSALLWLFQCFGAIGRTSGFNKP